MGVGWGSGWEEGEGGMSQTPTPLSADLLLLTVMSGAKCVCPLTCYSQFVNPVAVYGLGYGCDVASLFGSR